jgi:hypothetical protein
MKTIILTLGFFLVFASDLRSETKQTSFEAFQSQLQTEEGKKVWLEILNKKDSTRKKDAWAGKALIVIENLLSEAKKIEPEEEQKNATLGIEYWSFAWAEKVEDPETVTRYFASQFAPGPGRAERLEHLLLWLSVDEKRVLRSKLNGFIGKKIQKIEKKAEAPPKHLTRTFEFEDIQKNPEKIFQTHEILQSKKLAELWKQLLDEIHALPADEGKKRSEILGRMLGSAYNRNPDGANQWEEMRVRVAEMWAVALGKKLSAEDLQKTEHLLQYQLLSDSEMITLSQKALEIVLNLRGGEEEAKITRLQSFLESAPKYLKIDRNEFQLLVEETSKP